MDSKIAASQRIITLSGSSSNHYQLSLSHHRRSRKRRRTVGSLLSHSFTPLTPHSLTNRIRTVFTRSTRRALARGATVTPPAIDAASIRQARGLLGCLGFLLLLHRQFDIQSTIHPNRSSA